MDQPCQDVYLQPRTCLTFPAFFSECVFHLSAPHMKTNHHVLISDNRNRSVDNQQINNLQCWVSHSKGRFLRLWLPGITVCFQKLTSIHPVLPEDAMWSLLWATRGLFELVRWPLTPGAVDRRESVVQGAAGFCQWPVSRFCLSDLLLTRISWNLQQYVQRTKETLSFVVPPHRVYKCRKWLPIRRALQRSWTKVHDDKEKANDQADCEMNCFVFLSGRRLARCCFSSKRMASKFPELPVASDEIFQSGFVPGDTGFMGQNGCGLFEVAWNPI